jgi:hypothetical protein
MPSSGNTQNKDEISKVLKDGIIIKVSTKVMDFLNLNCAGLPTLEHCGYQQHFRTSAMDSRCWAEATVGWSKCGPYQIATDLYK